MVILFDAKLNFAKRIRSAHQKDAGMRSTLNRLISPKSNISLRHKVLLYKVILRPFVLNVSPIWAGAAATHLKRLHVFKNIQLRRAANPPKSCKFIANFFTFTENNISLLLRASLSSFLLKQAARLSQWRYIFWEYKSAGLDWPLTSPARSAAIPEWKSTTYSNALYSINTRLTPSSRHGMVKK
ncbi:hypothetical protein TNCV_4331431 [Trichonephila clavipes]|nr:hypothetical protein TNCV_4331431 [Trichonephila clavipes]